jgi:hypothetical protein
MRVSLLIIAATLTGAGCSRPQSHEAVRPVAGYDFEVHRAGGGRTTGNAATFSVHDGANVTQLKDGRLTVNGKGYGSIADGAKIVVDETGKVTINGQAHSPE